MYYQEQLWVAKNEKNISIIPKMANRHGLVAGATGTGKTITLKVLAESFSDAGVPVFVSDIKGDLSGMSVPGVDSEGMQKRITKFGLSEAGFTYKSYPTTYWDVFGEKGHPIRVTISEMGPMLLARILELNETQEGILDIVFRVADDQKLLLLDMKDLRAMVAYVGEHAAEYKNTYGNVSSQSIGAIQRALLKLEDEGANQFFGEPALDLKDWLNVDADGRGMIQVLNCEKLFLQPTLYGTFLLWMLSELYEMMPEVGDLDKPKMVFFFDEAHLIFKDASKAVLEKVEQIVRLIRSKGIGIYFITQSPTDVPDTILSQLGNRIQHALRAYSPSDQKAVKVAADTFRANPLFQTDEVITQLETGEALVSFLDEKGAPSMVERVHILPPQSLMGPADAALVQQMIASSPMAVKYNTAVDRESAYELLAGKADAARKAQEEAEVTKQQEEAQQEQAVQEEKEQKELEKQAKALAAEEAKKQKEIEKAAREKAKEEQEKQKEIERLAKQILGKSSGGRKKKSTVEKMATSAVNSFGRQAANSLVRGLFGILKK
jgi:DNA helicase HerA-like ATPase